MPDLNLLAPNGAFAAVALFGAAVAVGLLRPSSRFGAAGLLCIVASTLLLATALLGIEGASALPGPLGIAGAPVGFQVDGLARWFLALIGVVGIAAFIYLPGYLLHLRGKAKPGLVIAGLAALFASMTGVVAADNAIAFFAFWEAMAVSSFLLVATDHERQAVRRAAFIYLGATRIGSAFLMAGFVWMYAVTGTWQFDEWLAGGQLAAGPAALMLVGLLTKAGSWPFHLWLPIAHPAAPGPVSAVMSGVMIKTAIYAIARFFVLGGGEAPWIGWLLVAAGAVSAIWGILFALLQHDLKRLLAYSSVENVGFILLALGTSLIAQMPDIADLALGAALFHALNHGVFKSLLFLGAGTVDASAHTREMDRLGGLVHAMPTTAATFFVGSASICALAPLSGFASEWLLYKGLFQMASTGATGELRLTGLLLLGWVALVGALALACFTKAFGVTFLGRPRTADAAHAKEGTEGMVVACVALATLSVCLGLLAPWVWTWMGNLGLVAHSTEWDLPTSAMALAGLVLAGAVAAFVHSLSKKRPGRTFTTWDCGFGPLGTRTQYTATSFVQPIARLFGALYRYETQVVVEGRQRRHFPTEVRAEASHEVYLESKVYTPGLDLVQKLSERFIMRLQAGSIHQYLLFMVLTLVLLLWLGGVL
jgi:hydrogenase-4 component B